MVHCALVFTAERSPHTGSEPPKVVSVQVSVANAAGEAGAAGAARSACSRRDSRGKRRTPGNSGCVC